MESEVKAALDPLVQARFPIFAQEHLRLLAGHSDLIAQWLTKTAIVCTHAMPGHQRVPKDLIPLADRPRPPRGVWVDIAESLDSRLAAVFSRAFLVKNGKDVMKVPHKEGRSFQFCVQISHLLLRVGMADRAMVDYRIAGSGPVPFRLFPTPVRDSPNFTFKNIEQFFNGVGLRTWKDCKGEVPESLT